jgi:hypothetical protein
MLMRMRLVIINAPTSAHDTTGPDVVALRGHHHLGNQVAKIDATLALNMIVALALVAVQNHADPDALAATRAQWLAISTAKEDRNSDLHAVRIEIALVWARWGVAPAVIISKQARHVVTAEVVPNLDLKAMDLAEAECLVFHGELVEVAPR